MVGFVIWTCFGVVVIAFNVLYQRWLRKKRNEGEPVRSMPVGNRIVMAVLGVALLAVGVVLLTGK